MVVILVGGKQGLVKMLASRRGFLRGLIAAPAIIKLAPLMRIKPIPLAPLFVEGDEIYNGVIVRQVASPLIVFRKEIFREYVRSNLFSPYSGSNFLEALNAAR